MVSQQKKRADPRGAATRTALIEAAESLFAESGVEGVSTRQIGAAIGSSNTNVVAYHFGSKDALIRAVYRHRLPDIDRRRRALFDQAEVGAEAAGSGQGLQSLVRNFFLPLFEQTDENGAHSYARFLAGLDRSGLIETRMEVSSEFPETELLFARLKQAMPEAARPWFGVRMRMIAGLVSSALLEVDRQADRSAQRDAKMFENAVAMAAAALAAPPPDAS